MVNMSRCFRFVKLQKNKIIFLLLTLLSVNAYAVTTSSWVSITQINSGWGTKRVGVITNGQMPNPNSCGSNPIIAQADENVANTTQILTIALSAFMAGKQVQLAIDDSSCSVSGYPLLIGISVK